MPRAVSIDEAAEALGVTPLTIRRWIKRSHLIGLRVGPKLIRVPVSEINRMRTSRIQAIGGRPEYPVV